jgi:hypothetical protein
MYSNKYFLTHLNSNKQVNSSDLSSAGFDHSLLPAFFRPGWEVEA